jgi:uncharacterized protein
MNENQATFRFYEELNDFLPSYKRKTSFSYSFKGNPSVKHVIEELGVPHVEVDMILVNGISVDFSYRLKKGDQVSVYPVFESFDISNVQRLRAKPLRNLKFILDVHLGRLSKYLRLLGFDTLFEKDLSDSQIINISLSQHRIILTRDRGLLKTGTVTHGYWIRSSKPTGQLKEIMNRFNLKSSLIPFSRCLECNGILEEVSKREIMELLLPKTRDFYSEFKKCRTCGKVYWEGSHYEKMKYFIQTVTGFK